KGILNEKYNYNGSISMITTEDVLAKVNQNNNPSGETDESYTRLNIEIEEDADSQNISEAIEQIVDETPGLHYTDMAAAAEEQRTMAIILSIFLYGFVTVIAIISAINIINTISTNIILRTREIAMIKAVGMSQSGIKKMVAFESIFYGIYATIIGGLAGTGLTYLLFRILIGVAEFEYQLPWHNVAIACGSAIIIALLSGIYPLRRINESIIVESMKVEN